MDKFETTTNAVSGRTYCDWCKWKEKPKTLYDLDTGSGEGYMCYNPVDIQFCPMCGSKLCEEGANEFCNYG